jgi:hypothetical protein
MRKSKVPKLRVLEGGRHDEPEWEGWAIDANKLENLALDRDAMRKFLEATGDTPPTEEQVTSICNDTLKLIQEHRANVRRMSGSGRGLV